MFKIIYKDINKSSFKAILDFKIANNIKKIGHTGTLDPLAQGLLLVATDDDTKLIPYIKNKEKEYKVIAKLGFISKTYDNEGPIEFVSNSVPNEQKVLDVINSFIGNIKQKPPIFSAKKINGKRAYELARNNEIFETNEIDITIFNIKNIEYKYPFISFETHVSSGTYIRTLVHDIGKKLKVGAYMTFLERTMINGLRKNDEIEIKNLIDLPSIEIKNKNELKNWIDGKIKNIKIDSNTYLVEFGGNIIGIVEIKNNTVTKTNLFGNKIQKILSLKE